MFNVHFLVFQGEDHDEPTYASPPPLLYNPSYLDSPEFQFESTLEEVC